MTIDQAEKQRARVARELGVDLRIMKNHPYDLDVGQNNSLLVRWHEQAPDGVIREGELGSYTTHIRSADDAVPQNFVEEVVRRFRSA